MSTDFFDRDLVDERVSAPESKPVDPVERLARKRDEITTSSAGAAHEIEILRRKQQEVERQRRELEELGQLQDGYERKKKEVLDKLSSRVVLLEKEETDAARILELIKETRARFKERLADLKRIREESWGDVDFSGRLRESLVVVEQALNEYGSAMARLDAAKGSGWQAGGEHAGARDLAGHVVQKVSFSQWFKAGLAFMLPFVSVIVLLFIVYVGLMVRGLV